MALTCRSMLYRCGFDLAREIAEVAGLVCLFGDDKEIENKLSTWAEANPMPANTIPWEASDGSWEAEDKRLKPIREEWLITHDAMREMIQGAYPKPQQWYQYWAWEDRATGGGGCRITWHEGLCWISAHSGYAWADITGEVSELFSSAGAVPIDPYENGYPPSPRSYGMDKFESWYARQGD